MMNWTQLITRFGIGAFADVIGVPYVTAQAMKRRNSCSYRHWEAIVEAAQARGWTEIDFEYLARMPRGTSQPARRKRLGNAMAAASPAA